MSPVPARSRFVGRPAGDLHSPFMLSPRLAAGALALALAACHKAAPPAAPPPAVKAPAVTAAPEAPDGKLRRAEVDQVLLQQGPAWVLRRVISEEVMGRDGKFTGWRMVGLPEEWRGIDLKPGDVVMRVNGMPIERPEQAFEAWKSVARLPAIKLTMLRDGAPREVTIPIDGAPSVETQKQIERGVPGPRAAAPAPAQPPPRRQSVQLGGSTPAAQDDEAY